MSAPDARTLRRLRWLLDAPLFVDEPLVDRLFDAVVRPEYEVQSREVGEISEEARRSIRPVGTAARVVDVRDAV